MKIKSELRKLNVEEKFISWVLKAQLTWEEKVALRDAIRKITSKEGVKKLLNDKKFVEVEFDEHPLGYLMTRKAGITFNTIVTDSEGIDHDTYRSVLLFDDLVKYNTMKKLVGFEYINKFKASLRTRYIENHMKGVKGFERKPLNF